MLVHLPNKSTFFSPMQTDPQRIREKLFEGIDKDYNVTNMGIVVEVLGELENVNMSREELENTRLGKHINQLRKNTSDKSLAGRAKSLIKKWRDLLGDGNSGPGPGGGNNNNNSSLATNGNTGSRLSSANVATTSPRLSNSNHVRGPNSRGAPPPSQHSPRLPPSLAPPSQSQSARQHKQAVKSGAPSPVPGGKVRSVPSSSPVPGAKVPVNHRSVPQSPAKHPVLNSIANGSGSRESPVVISSGGSSPVSVQSVHSNSRPESPEIEIIKSREVSPLRSRTSSPGAVVIGSKRHRPKDDHDRENGPNSKHAKLDLPNGGSVPTSPNHLRESRPRKNARRSRQPVTGNSGYDLTMQMLQATKGKVRTTQELVSSLGIESRVQTSPPVPSVTDLVPNENKSELMDRFFSSQAEDTGGQFSEGPESEPPSRPSTAVSQRTVPESSSEATSTADPRSVVNTPAPPRESVEDILAMLPPIDSEAVLAELEQEIAEQEPEIEGLIPAYKPQQEITSSLIDELNNGHLEHIGGITDHNGDFKEWHEMASLQSKDGELLHILPYSVID